MAKTLLMMNALTNAVTNAKPSRPLPKIPMNWLTPSDASSATCSPVITSVRSGRCSGDRRLHLRRVGALGDADVDRVEEPA